MTKVKYLMAAAATAALVGAWPLIASGQTAQDPHHPAGGTTAQQAAPAAQSPTATTPGMGGQPGMMGSPQGMMGQGMMGGMPMMNMMGMMGQGGPGMAGAGPCGPGMSEMGMATIDHVEGRIAFLRTELKITEAQAGAWNAFADALRANAKKLGEVRTAMMPQASGGEPQVPTMARRPDFQEHWLAARLEGTRTIKSAFAELYDALSAEQRKTADELLAPHMGMPAMAMMPMGGASR